MLLPDCHLHTRFSSDSNANPDDIINKALQLNLSSICFTDHNDFDWPLDNGEVLFDLDFNSYISYMKQLQAKYASRIPIYIGVEQGLAATCARRVDDYDPDNQLDFIIGSSHLVYGKDPYEKEFWLGTDIDEAVTAYYESIVENIDTCNNYDVYGHLDYIARYIPDKNYPYHINNYMDIIETILKKLIDKGKGIEINTAGLRYGMGAPNPDLSVLKLYHDLGGEIITVGSDAHKPEDVATYHKQAYHNLNEAGFKYFTIFKSRKPQFITL